MAAEWVGFGDVRVTGGGQQVAPATAALAGGGWVVAWITKGSNNGVDFAELHAQRFDAGGARVGGELVLSPGPALGTPGLAALADGGFLATWDSRPDPTGPTSYLAQRFDAAGAAVGGTFQVNSVPNPDQASSAEPTGLAGGGFLVEWWSDPDGPAVWGPSLQLYDRGGAPVGGNTPLGLDADGTPFGDGTHINGAAVAATPDGGYAAVWTTATAYVPGSGSVEHVYLQRFDAAGRALVAPTEVIATSTGALVIEGVEAAVQAASGELLVSLRGVLPDGRSEITAQRFDAAGRPLGTQQTLVFADPVIDSRLTALSDGTFVVSWLHWQSEQQVVFSQHFDAAGNRLGEPLLVGSAKALYAEFSVAPTAGGGAVFAWDDGRLDLGDVYQERFAPSSAVGGDQVAPTVVGFAPADEAVSVPINTNIEVSFSEAVQKGSGSIVIRGPGGAVVAAYDVASSSNVTVSGNLLTINPSTDLAYSTGYAIELAPGSIRDLAGNAYAGSSTYNFTTGGPPEGPDPSPVVNGTGGNDVLTGSTGGDSINAGGGDDLIMGRGGNDTIDGGDGRDTVIIDVPIAGVQAYSWGGGVLTVTMPGTTSSASVTATIVNTERVRLNDGLFALDTSGPGGHAWQAAALFHAGFGVLPGLSDLSHWTAEADRSASMGVLAQKMIDQYAPGVSSDSLVAHLYVQLVHQAPSAATVQQFVDQIGPGRTFATQGDLLAYAASLSLNTDGMAGFVGTPQQLDPSWF